MNENLILAEQAVIGAMLIDPACVPDVLSVLSAEDFQSDLLRDFFEAARELHDSGQKIDPVLIIDRIPDATEQTTNYAAELMELTPTSANVLLHAGIVKEQAQRRRLKDAILNLNFGVWPTDMLNE